MALLVLVRFALGAGEEFWFFCGGPEDVELVDEGLRGVLADEVDTEAGEVRAGGGLGGEVAG